MRLATSLLIVVTVMALATAAVADKPMKWSETWQCPTRGLLDCTNAVTITCPATVDGNNTGAPNDVEQYSCTLWVESGGELVYALTLENTCYQVTATLSNMTADFDVFILGSCDEADCLTYGDSSATTSCLVPGTYYIVVDGYNGATGTFTLDVTCAVCDCPTPPCCPTPYDCYVLDFNIEPYGYVTEPCEGGGPAWEHGALATPGVPPVACDDVPVTNVLGTVLGGDYVECGERLIVGPFLITDNCYCLELCHYYDTEAGYDGGNVKVSTAGGAWQVVAPQRGYDDVGSSYGSPCIAGQEIFTGHQFQTAWLRDCFDLTDYIGMEIMVALDFGADSSVFYPGWYIKWIKIGGSEVSPSEDRTWGSIKSKYR